MNVLPVGGKDDNNTLRSVTVSNDGAIKTNKNWKNDVLTLFDDSVTTSGTIKCTKYDVSKYVAVCLYVSNKTNVDIKIGFYRDIDSHDYALLNSDGNMIQKTIKANTNNLIITPDDIPLLQWLKTLKVYIIVPSSSNEISGSITVHATAKG